MPQIKRGPVTVEHDEEFKKDVVISRGEASITVPMELLRVLVAESIRRELAAHVMAMKPVDLLRRIA